MTVGQPETNLNTWGLRYVKKKEPIINVHSGEEVKEEKPNVKQPTPTPPESRYLREDESKLHTPSGRQNDSSGDTTGVYSGGKTGWQNIVNPKGTHAGGEKVGEQTHVHASDAKDFGRRTTTTTHGSTRGEGATGSKTETGQALTQGGKLSTGLEGSKQTHTGSKGYDYTGQEVPQSKGGHTIKPDSRNPKSEANPKDYSSRKPSKTPKGTMIQRAALDLAIIKCKLLKMNNIQKKGIIEENKPTRPQFRKEDDEVTQDEKTEASKQNIARQRESSKQDSEEKLGQHNFYKSEDVVDKAIELINMAYDEINKDAKDGKQGGKPKEPREIYAGDLSDPENWKKTKEPDTTQQSRASQELRGRIEDVGSANLPTADVRHTELGREGYDDSVVGHHKVEHIIPEDRPDKQGNRRSVAETNRPQQSDFSDTASSTSVTTDGQERDNKGQLTGKADGGTSTTSSEGGFNHVYSDVHEKKKQEDARARETERDLKGYAQSRRDKETERDLKGYAQSRRDKETERDLKGYAQSIADKQQKRNPDYI